MESLFNTAKNTGALSVKDYRVLIGTGSDHVELVDREFRFVLRPSQVIRSPLLLLS